MQTNEPQRDNSSTSAFRQTVTASDKTDAEPLHDLNASQRDVLRIVAGGERTGQEIRTAFEESHNRELNPSQIYPLLNALVDKGLVSKTTVDGRTNKYAITQRGEREVDCHRTWWTASLSASDGGSDGEEDGGGSA